MRTQTLIVAQIEIALDESERFEFEGLLVDRVYTDLRAHEGFSLVGSPYVILAGLEPPLGWGQRRKRSAKTRQLPEAVQAALTKAALDADRRVTE